MAALLNFWNTYHVLILSVIWPLISGIINLAARKKTEEEWVAYCAQKPRMAGLLRLFRAIGFDPAKAMRSFREFAQAKADASPSPVAALKDTKQP